MKQGYYYRVKPGYKWFMAFEIMCVVFGFMSCGFFVILQGDFTQDPYLIKGKVTEKGFNATNSKTDYYILVSMSGETVERRNIKEEEYQMMTFGSNPLEPILINIMQKNNAVVEEYKNLIQGEKITKGFVTKSTGTEYFEIITRSHETTQRIKADNEYFQKIKFGSSPVEQRVFRNNFEKFRLTVLRKNNRWNKVVVWSGSLFFILLSIGYSMSENKPRKYKRHSEFLVKQQLAC